jgi:hypothetical protein
MSELQNTASMSGWAASNARNPVRPPAAVPGAEVVRDIGFTIIERDSA